jgi:phage gpG-like protein
MNPNFIRIASNVRSAMATIPYKAGVIMVAFSKQRFQQQNWINHGTEPWQRRSRKKGWSNKGKVKNNSGRAILIQSGRLRRSIRIVNTTANSATIGSDTPYAAIHNNGGRVTGTQRVRTHVRINKKRDSVGVVSSKEGKRSTRIRFGKLASGISIVREHTRKMNHYMPRRRFMGESKYLSNQIGRMIEAEILNALKR